jgi:hypothetical protein
MDLEELVYEPVKPNFYNYYAKNSLNTNIDELLETSKIDKIYIVAYEINNNGVYPFLQFLLLKSIELTLPYIPLSNPLTNSRVTNTEELLKLATYFLLNEIKFSSEKSIIDTEMFFDGFYDYNNEVYLFVDVTEEKLNLHDIYSDSVIRFALVDEILNQKNVCYKGYINL